MSLFIRIKDTFIKRKDILSVSIDSNIPSSLSRMITGPRQLPQLNIWLNSLNSDKNDGVEIVTFNFESSQDRDAIYNIVFDIVQQNVEVLL